MTEQVSERRWRSQPLFISSTFRDMQAERDHLHEEVFPALEEWLLGHRTLLEPLDLRWGVETTNEAEAEDKEKLVLKVCLDGIVECRPYLIVLLGDRYGWQPPAKRLIDTASEHGFRPEEVDGMSVTALEIEAGVLCGSDQAPRSLIYLRTPLPYDKMSEELRPVYSDLEAGNADAAERLEALKQRLRSDAQVNCTRDYTLVWDTERQCPTSESLRAWGQQVLADLETALAVDVEAHAAQSGEPSWHDEEAFELEAFVEHRARIFVGRGTTIHEAEALALEVDKEGSSWAALYTGEAGAGKSALIAELYRRWKCEAGAGHSQHNTVVLAHAAGISRRSARITPMLRRWIGELAALQGVDERISDDDDHEAVAAAFRDLVNSVARHRRVVLLVDAINQFDAHAWQDQSWVPAARPNIRMIVTAIPGAASERLLTAHQGVEHRVLPSLQAEEAGEIAAALCARYRKTLADTVLTALKRHPSAGNALWLRMAIDELLLLDADDFEQAQRHYSDRATDTQIPAYMEHLVNNVFPADVTGMYGHLLGRLEERFGVDTVRAFAVAIALSRSGWREHGLRELIPRLGGNWNDAIGANLRRAFRLHLIRHGDPSAWDFFHQVAREAVLKRYPASREEREAQHETIAAYLAGLPGDDPITNREWMHHLIEADHIHAAAAFYAKLKEVHSAHTPATESIAERIIDGEGADGVNQGLLLVDRLLDEAAQASENWLELPNNLMFYVLGRTRGNVQVSTARALMVRIHQWYMDHQPAEPTEFYLWALSVSHEKLADLERVSGNPEAERSHHEQAFVITRKLHKLINKPGTAGDVAVGHGKLGDIEFASGNPEAARLHYEQAMAISQALHEGIDSAETAEDLAFYHDRLGYLETDAGNLDAARSHYEQAMAIFQAVDKLGGSTDTARGIAISHDKLGGIKRALDGPEAARWDYEQALAIRQDLYGRIGGADTATDLVASHGNIGDIERATGNMTAASFHYRQMMAIVLDLHERIGSAETGRSLAVCQGKLGEVECDAGNLEGARWHYEQAIAIKRDLHERIDSVGTVQDLATSYCKLGDLERTDGNPEAAEKHYKAAKQLLGH